MKRVRKRNRRHKRKVPKISFHHFYPKPYRNLDHTPQAGEYLNMDFHRWVHHEYSNYELAHSYHDEESIDSLMELYKMVV